MKLSKQTLAVLENFASINSSIVIEKGSFLKTMSLNQVIVAEANIDDSFDSEMSIYDLKEFLGMLDLFNEEPNVDVQGETVKLSTKSSQCSYQLADKSLITHPPDRIKFPTAQVVFELGNEDLKQVLNAGKKMRLPDVKFYNKDGSIYAAVTDTRESTSHDFNTKVCNYSGDKDFEVYLKLENIKMVPGDYKAQIYINGEQGAIKFDGNVINYVIVAEANSKMSD